ncbi:hypothetical protein L798_06487 [Zootermopsis nevadensis]|uniref:Uncharacterized protein n=1 Tax=Zootermopsis nevadensis TaxID=136037 RepID=A0A067QPQ9_ZOONE|nr:hypothetical protein L798_06487 [Zootermopsis nevadensis]
MVVCTQRMLKVMVHISHMLQGDHKVRIKLSVLPRSKSGRFMHHQLPSHVDRLLAQWILSAWAPYCNKNHPTFKPHCLKILIVSYDYTPPWTHQLISGKTH